MKNVFVYALDSTEIPLWITWNHVNNRAEEILFRRPQKARSVRPPDHEDAPKKLTDLCRRLTTYQDGKVVNFPLHLLDMSGFSEFRYAVSEVVCEIPHGSVLTYGQVAKAAGSSGAARGVGQVMARNPFPIAIPCHRVVESHGGLGGFSGGLKLKRRLLTLESQGFELR